jgi:hypothetical protein
LFVRGHKAVDLADRLSHLLSLPRYWVRWQQA